MLAYDNRFHGHSSLRYVFKNGETIRTRLITLRVTSNRHRKTSRFSVSISKKVLKSAVKRNRVRRRIYEILRLEMSYFEGVYDAVFIVTSPEILMIDHDTLKESVTKALVGGGLLPTSDS